MFLATRGFVVRTLSGCGSWGLLSGCSAGASALVASLVAERELELHGLQELLGSVAVTLGL